MYKRTEKYVRQNISVTQQETVKRILTDKSFQNRERLTEIQKRVHDLLGKANLYISGDEIEIGGKDPQLRAVQAFSSLVLRAYPNLRMLGGIAYTEDDITEYLNQSQDSLFGSDATILSEPEQEMQAFVQGNRRNGVRTTLKSLVEQFERKPYGWHLGAVLCVLAKLCARGKIEARSNGDILEDENLKKALRNTHGYGNIVLDPQIDFTASQLRRLKTFYEDFFDSPPKGREAKELGRETAEAFNLMVKDLATLSGQIDQYPFLAQLDQPAEQVNKLAGKPYTHYLTELGTFENTLMDLKESILDPIRRFMTGPNKEIYQVARRYLQEQEPNLPYAAGDEAGKIQNILADATCYKGNQMQQVKTYLEALKANIAAQVKAEAGKAAGAIATLRDRLVAMDEFIILTGEQQAELERIFETKQNEIEYQRLIAVIRDTLRRFEDEEYPRLLSRLESWGKPGESDSDYKTPEGQGKGEVADPTFQFIPARSIDVCFDKPWLADESDVERYLELLREALLVEIRTGKRIQI